jgi:hypothetical protein
MTACPLCGEENTRIVVSDTLSFDKVYHNQEHYECDNCGFTGVNGSMMDRNQLQPTTEICGPFKPIEIGSIHMASAYFDWSWRGIGFGQLSFSSKNGKITCMNECMSRERVRELLRAFADHIADNCVLDDE